MAAPRKYDQETRDRAVRMYRDRRRDQSEESGLQARRRVGELLDVRPKLSPDPPMVVDRRMPGSMENAL